ncbi:hypothetical protein [Aurantiacibacter spongiae]|nr:hypothetical protein [Aurantiacibacter spongiae]
MTNFNAVSTRILAGLGAVTMTLTLIVSSFANPHATTVVGILA